MVFGNSTTGIGALYIPKGAFAESFEEVRQPNNPASMEAISRFCTFPIGTAKYNKQSSGLFHSRSIEQPTENPEGRPTSGLIPDKTEVYICKDGIKFDNREYVIIKTKDGKISGYLSPYYLDEIKKKTTGENPQR